MMYLLPIALLSAGLWTVFARIGVRSASGGEDHVAPQAVFLAALLGAAAGLLANNEDPAASILSVLVCSGFLTGALVDRQTGWAPDAIVFPVSVLALVLGAVNGAWDISPLWAAIYAAIGYWIVQAIWIAIAWKYPDFSLPPPGDLIALAIPMLFLGADLRFASTMMAIAVLLLLARQFPPVYRLFSRPDLIMRIANEESKVYPEGGHGITFLALAFPATAVSLIISSMV